MRLMKRSLAMAVMNVVAAIIFISLTLCPLPAKALPAVAAIRVSPASASAPDTLTLTVDGAAAHISLLGIGKVDLVAAPTSVAEPPTTPSHGGDGAPLTASAASATAGTIDASASQTRSVPGLDSDQDQSGGMAQPTSTAPHENEPSAASTSHAAANIGKAAGIAVVAIGSLLFFMFALYHNRLGRRATQPARRRQPATGQSTSVRLHTIVPRSTAVTRRLSSRSSTLPEYSARPDAAPGRSTPPPPYTSGGSVLGLSVISAEPQQTEVDAADHREHVSLSMPVISATRTNSDPVREAEDRLGRRSSLSASQATSRAAILAPSRSRLA